jgi:hypothetical protein
LHNGEYINLDPLVQLMCQHFSGQKISLVFQVCS